MNRPMTEFEKAEKFYQLIREQVRSEDELYNRRITWLISMQAFLFASVGLIVSKSTMTDLANDILRAGIFLLVAATGILVALTSHKVLSTGRKAMFALKCRWDEYEASLGPEMRNFFPHPRGMDDRDPAGRMVTQPGSTAKALQYSDTPASRGLSTGNLPFMFVAIWLGFICLLAYSFAAAPGHTNPECPEPFVTPAEDPSPAFAPG